MSRAFNIDLGSSPLTRGKHLSAAFDRAAGGLIPAHAGKTADAWASLCRGRAHPRSRGENAASASEKTPGWGSSPLTRGKRRPAEPAPAAAGLIPAHAGKTLMFFAMVTPPPAHPRSRGENDGTTRFNVDSTGSSPLTRGKPRSQAPRARPRRLIPAHAGKTPGNRAASRCPTAHPRSRGENFAPRGTRAHLGGSSPLTRGKRLRGHVACRCPGLIPAHAGKTLPDLRFYCADRSDLGNP